MEVLALADSKNITFVLLKESPGVEMEKTNRRSVRSENKTFTVEKVLILLQINKIRLIDCWFVF